MPQVYFGWSVSRITTDASTVVFTGAGIIHGVLIEVLGTAPGTATIRDNATVLTVIDTSTAGQLNRFIELDLAIGTNLTIVTAAGATKATLAVLYSSGSSPRTF